MFKIQLKVIQSNYYAKAIPLEVTPRSSVPDLLDQPGDSYIFQCCHIWSEVIFVRDELDGGQNSSREF